MSTIGEIALEILHMNEGILVIAITLQRFVPFSLKKNAKNFAEKSRNA